MGFIAWVLGLVANNTKVFKYLGLLAVVAGLGYVAKHSFYVWHVEPMEKLEKELKTANEKIGNLEETAKAFPDELKKIKKECKQQTVNDVLGNKLEDLNNEKNITIQTGTGKHVIEFND